MYKRLLFIVFLLSSVSTAVLAGDILDHELIHSYMRYDYLPDGDSIMHVYHHDVYIYPPLKFKSKKQERFYWRTVRDVKKTLPYARSLRKDIIYADRELAKLETRREQKQWFRRYERELYHKYEDDFRSMYASQGKMLMLLLDRECNHTSFELIEHYKSKFVANFWQFIAKLFKNDLKEEYDAEDKDRITERVINLVSAGQL
ncbi:MAG: DUF4294 domain-containing protein [Paludibacteraceae bacterium]|nr:DUF4294 domain-containing protein [Paludibacteraceae bacterium]